MGGGGNNSKSSDGFIDRSKVRILLCDNDSKSLEAVFGLLCKCSYQVTSVSSPRQVIDALNAEGPDTDIILTEVDLPMAKGMKMLKYITRDKDLQRIPVIMMSAQDEMSVVVKCLRLGAADYLVKPLRTNELLNLWTHMWRRRRMLGLIEKNILNYNLELVESDPSDANTNSTTLFSDDTDDKSKKNTNSEMDLSMQKEHESNDGAVGELPPKTSSEYESDVLGIIDRQRSQILSGPKKTQLKIGESSAFFTYVKSSMMGSKFHQAPHLDRNAPHERKTEEILQVWSKELDNCTHGQENGNALESNPQEDDFRSSNSVLKSYSIGRSSTPTMVLEFSQHGNNLKEVDSSEVILHPKNDPQVDSLGFPQSSYPYYMPGMANVVMAPSSSSSPSMYHINMQDLPNHASSTMFSQYSQLPQCPQIVGMAPFPYYPVSLCLQPGQMSSSHPWPPIIGPASTDLKLGKVDRREAALMKFRQKRKQRCFDKKIRYVNRKRLAERRPRVRGQFVRRVNGVNVDLNGLPDSVDFNEDEEDEEEEEASSREYFPEDDA